MKAFKSSTGVIFSNHFSYSLDQENKVVRFSKLWQFLCEFDPDAIEEWRVKHNFIGWSFSDIIKTLVSIEKLTE